MKSDSDPIGNLLAPLSRPIEAAQGVVGSLQRAAASTGVDFGFLVRTAQRESSLNPNAKAQTSSAAGLFQFVEQTWLGTLKAHGAKHGYGAYADQIVRGSNGKYTVPDKHTRQTILSLRYNAEAASSMAAEMTAGHAAYLKGRIGRNPTGAELYAAHFLGPAGAGDLIGAVNQRPLTSAASLFPQAAAANRSIFYAKGKPVTVAELMQNLGKHTQSQIQMPSTPLQMDTPDISNQTLYATQMKRIEMQQAILELAFGSPDKGTLFQAQLLSGFGPEKDSESGAVMSQSQGAKGIDWG